jgi:NAD(P)-dependent dehydrogenase (short-subunit alcohol dehydrogenase family)
MTTAPFHGSTALITGAGGDIGRAAAVRLAAGGAALILADHEEAAAGVERTAGLVAEQPSTGSSVRLFDVTSADQVRGALAAVPGP